MKNCGYCSLKEFNTFKIDVKAKKIVIIKNINDILNAWCLSQIEKLPFVVLGKGSNVLFIKNYDGIVLINKLKGINIYEDKKFWYLHVNSGETWHSFVIFTLKKGFFGLENLALIPGTIGAASIQNIGAYGVEFNKFCNYIDVLNCNNNKIIRFNNKECKFSYRDSKLKHCCRKGLVVISVGIRLEKKWKPIIHYYALKKLNRKNLNPKKIFDFICKIRKEKIPDPKIIGNAGSFFKNPIIDIRKIGNIITQFSNLNFFYEKKSLYKIKLFAGQLIEECHLKGYSIGGASIYNKHALILINKQHATWKDIILLFKHIQSCVKKKFNIFLKPEVQFISSKNKF